MQEEAFYAKRECECDCVKRASNVHNSINKNVHTNERTNEYGQPNGRTNGVVCSFCSIQPTELIHTARRCVYKKNFYSLLSNILRCLFASTKNTKDKGNSDGDGSSNILLLLAKKVAMIYVGMKCRQRKTHHASTSWLKTVSDGRHLQRMYVHTL